MESPKHVGIILDGNRRYAKALGKKPWEGHEKGAENIKEIINEASKKGIKELSLFTFSTENFKRSKLEVEFLMKLFKRAFKEIENDDAYMKNYRIVFAGEKSLFPKDIWQLMLSIEEKTRKNPGVKINFCMGYGGRSEIIMAMKRIIEAGIKSEDITEELLSQYLYIQSDLDLLIRTSGEKRTSGFLTWQSTYAELLFIDKFWPEFTRQDLNACIDEFNNRKRRFGK